MAISNRAAVFAKLHKVLKKYFQPVEPPERSVLEHLVYACLLENATYTATDNALARMQQNAFDWNEVRVTTITELSESLKGLPDPKAAATRVKRTLQSVFESQYSFELDHLRKQNLGKTEKDLAKLSGTTPFAISYLTQHSLGGHSIPIDDGALECLYIVGAIDEKEKNTRSVPGLERAIAKKAGVEFGSLLHQMGAEIIANPFANSVKDILLEIAPDAQPRLPKRQRKKTETAGEAPTEVTEKQPEPVAEASKKKEAAKKEKEKEKEKEKPKEPESSKKVADKKESKSAAKEPAPTPAPAKKKSSPPPPKPTVSKKGPEKKMASEDAEAKKKSSAKQLTRRKPR